MNNLRFWLLLTVIMLFLCQCVAYREAAGPEKEPAPVGLEGLRRLCTSRVPRSHDEALSPAYRRQAQGERGEKEFKDDVIYQKYNKKSNLFLLSL